MPQPPEFDDQEYLKEQQEALRESIAFYSPEKKVEREAWIVSTFLDNLDVPYAESDFSPETSDPPDIYVLGARFEIKEIQDPNRRRHEEYRQKLEKALMAKSACDLLEQYIPKDLTYQEIGDRVTQLLITESKHYAPKVIQQLDLLVYVNLRHRLFDPQSPVPDSAIFSVFDWRSISVVRGWSAWVLYARSDSPPFLQANLGKPVSRPSMV